MPKQPVLRSGIAFVPPDPECACTAEPCDHYVVASSGIDDGYGDQQSMPEGPSEVLLAAPPGVNGPAGPAPAPGKVSFRYAVRQVRDTEGMEDGWYGWDSWHGNYTWGPIETIEEAHRVTSQWNENPENRRLVTPLEQANG